MSSGLPGIYKTLSDPRDVQFVNEEIKNERPEDSLYTETDEGVPIGVVKKLEETKLTNDNDNETSLKYNYNHLFQFNKTYTGVFLLFLDLILVGIYFTIIGYAFAWFLNKYAVQDLKVKKEANGYKVEDSKPKVFCELILECVALIGSIYSAIQIGLRLPYLLKESPLFHRDYRVYSGGIILIYTLMSLQNKMREKAKYVFDSESSKKDINTFALLECIKEIDGSNPTWIKFRDCVDSIS